MAGRITRTSPREAITKEFGVTRFAEVDWHPRYSVAPRQIVETIIFINGEKRLGPMRWGFVSPTAKAEARSDQRTDRDLELSLDSEAVRVEVPVTAMQRWERLAPRRKLHPFQLPLAIADVLKR